MKKLIVITLGMLLFTACQKPLKIAYVDIEEIMKEYKGTKDIEAEMKVKSESLKKELDSLVINWQDKARAYQNKAQRMSSQKRAEQEQSLMQEQQQINQRQQEVQMQVQNEGQEKLKQITDEIKTFMDGYAKENGYNFVLGTSKENGNVMYGEAAADITDDVLVKLNKSYKNKK
ncbi:MAG: hypothetical protein CSA39_02485 [Flavobacteriales bacterium]|nr:MAG: hypothetical protein CSA39_02485 [Flavobacteriales bacterium]